MLEDPHTCVIGQRPGDVVYATNQVYHAVLLGYKKGYTKDDDKWGIIGGNIVLKAEDHGAALRYVSGSTIGVSKGSRVAWLRVLSAFTHMEGRGWSEENFEEEKQRFLQRRSVDPLFVVRSASAYTRYSKKRKRTAILAAARAAKK